MAVSIIKDFLLGVKSGAEVQRIAHLSFEDQRKLLGKESVSQGRNIADQVSTSIRTLASIGNWGKRPGNVNHELLNSLGEPRLPKPTKVDVTLKVPKPKARKAFTKFVRVGYPLILPHILFAFLFMQNRASFDDLIMGATRGAGSHVETFWKSVLTKRGGSKDRGAPDEEQVRVDAVHGSTCGARRRRARN